jgi:calcineurin-like phosphoesterase family protein
MSNVWFTSDLHFGHRNIIQYTGRPYSSVEEMDQALIDNWNSRIAPEDEVYVLGDFSLYQKEVPETLAKLNGARKVLISGNHDRCFSEAYGTTSRIGKKWTNFYLNAGFSAVLKDLLMPIGDQVVLLSHFPWQNKEATDQRYRDLRPVKKWGKQLLCHGHSHGKKEDRLKDGALDIGCDAHDYMPWSLEEIRIELGLSNL